jgi:hypothetical protein
MRNIICALILVLLETASAFGQVHSLPQDTKGNQIELTVANRDPAMPAGEIEVIRHPSEMVFTSNRQTIENVPPQSERTVSFHFDVGRLSSRRMESSPSGEVPKDTLRFSISDGNGMVQERSIIVTYALPTAFALERTFPIRSTHLRQSPISFQRRAV